MEKRKNQITLNSSGVVFILLLVLGIYHYVHMNNMRQECLNNVGDNAVGIVTSFGPQTFSEFEQTCDKNFNFWSFKQL